MKPITLKGSAKGYYLIFNQDASISELNVKLLKLLTELNKKGSEQSKLKFKILTGHRLYGSSEKQAVNNVFQKFPRFVLRGIQADVISAKKAKAADAPRRVQIVYRTIRNGEQAQYHGDILFLGRIHQGGHLVTDGNIFVMGDVLGMIHAGYPNSEDKIIMGDLHNAQQVRIGEQYDVVADRQVAAEKKVIAYVNDLHALKYGKTTALRKINPKFYHQIGGLI